MNIFSEYFLIEMQASFEILGGGGGGVAMHFDA